MEGLIRRDAPAHKASTDVRRALENAAALGGSAKQICEERLGPVLSLVEMVTAQLDKARQEAEPRVTAINASKKSAAAILDAVHDDLWGAVGRPASDATLSLLFPGGTSYYAEGTADEQADRMELLAQLLSAGMHPRLPMEQARAAAKEVRGAAKALRDSVDAARTPRARVRLLERASEVVAQSAQKELSLLRRRLLAEGINEADIEAIYSGKGVEKAETPPVPEGGLKLA